MSSIQNISNAPKDTNVSLSYVGGLLFPGTSGNRLLMSYYIDWGITFNDSGEIHSTYDFVNYLLNKNIAISNNLQTCVNQISALSIRVDELSTTLSSNISSINTQLNALSNRIDKLEGNQTIPVTGISISNKITSLTVGSTHQLNVSIDPSNASNKTIIWSSSNSMCAEVSDTGLIKANGTGSVTITAKSASNPSITDTCTFEVKANVIKVTKITVNPVNTSNTITYGNTATATATIEPSNASNNNITWKSNNTAVATINSSTGKITPVKAGTFTITATANDGSGVTDTSSNITVNRATQTINASNKIITYGTTGNSLTATTTTGNGTISYKVKEGSSVSINSSTGALTINSTGNTTITVTASQTDQYNTATKDVTVTVNKASQTLSVSANPSTIEIGGTTTAKVSGNKTTPVTWSSSNANIVTVNSTTGLITGKAGGTATITATAPSNEYYNEGKGTVSIKVSEPAQPEETYYYYYGIQNGTVASPSSPITASNYKTLAESSTTLKDSMTIAAKKGYAYVLVPNTVTEVKWFDLNANAYSTMKFNVVDTSIPGHLVYRSENPFSSGNARLDFNY